MKGGDVNELVYAPLIEDAALFDELEIVAYVASSVRSESMSVSTPSLARVRLTCDRDQSHGIRWSLRP
jgi:hypothetical protein